MAIIGETPRQAADREQSRAWYLRESVKRGVFVDEYGHRNEHLRPMPNDIDFDPEYEEPFKETLRDINRIICRGRKHANP